MNFLTQIAQDLREAWDGSQVAELHDEAEYEDDLPITVRISQFYSLRECLG